MLVILNMLYLSKIYKSMKIDFRRFPQTTQQSHITILLVEVLLYDQDHYLGKLLIKKSQQNQPFKGKNISDFPKDPQYNTFACHKSNNNKNINKKCSLIPSCSHASYNYFINMEMTQQFRQIYVKEVTQEPNFKPFSEIYQIKCCSVIHQNSVEFLPSINKNQEFRVTSNFSASNGNQIIKTTQVFCQDQIIKIIDKFTSIFCPEPIRHNSLPVEEKKVKKNSIKHKVLMDKQSTMDQQPGERPKRYRDMRSAVKNIFRMFEHWVENNTPISLKLGSSMSILRKANGTYNNHLIVNLSKNQQLRNAFLTFCQSQGDDYIKHSKIHDKQAHLEALNVYHKLCKDEKEKDLPPVKVQEAEPDNIIHVLHRNREMNDNSTMKEEIN